MDIADTTVSEVAERNSATIPVFIKSGIDLCCGGGKTVREAAALHGIPLAKLLADLEAAAATPAAGGRSR
ncbi:MAG: DUF542 domain-containing protein [Dehalococcoidia bacterium]